MNSEMAYWDLEMLVFEQRGKPENPEKNLSERNEGTKNKLNPHMAKSPESNPGHIGGR